MVVTNLIIGYTQMDESYEILDKIFKVYSKFIQNRVIWRCRNSNLLPKFAKILKCNKEKIITAKHSAKYFQ